MAASSIVTRVRSRLTPLREQAPAFVLAGTLWLTALTAALVAVTGRTRERAQFENAVQAAGDRVRGRLDAYVALLEHTSALWTTDTLVTRGEFSSFVGRLDVPRLYVGALGVGYSRRLAVPRGADAFTLATAARRGNAPVARVWPDSARDEYHAVAYLEPLNRRNLAAVGFDMSTEASRRSAMHRARDTGRPAATGPVTLVQELDDRRHAGFLVYVPVYRGTATPATVRARRDSLRGFVYAPFRSGDLFRGIFGSEREPRVAFRVFDGADTTGRLLFDSHDTEPGSASHGTDLHAQVGDDRELRQLDMAGRRWTVLFTPLPDDGAMPWRSLTAATAVLGTMLAFLLFFLTRAERRARRQAERSEASRGRFYAAMSHELRTPLNAIIGYNDLLLAGVYGPLPEAQRDGLERSQRAARHLLELVNDVLDLSKLEAGEPTLEFAPLRLDALIDDLLATIHPLAEERGCPLRVEGSMEGTEIVSDARRVRQILLNLLSNATKFGAGQPVTLRCAAITEGPLAGGAMMEVEDAGPGVAPEDAARIFEEFVQLPGATPGGTGLGLPISRRLAELLGGSLTLSPRPGAGAVFRLELPPRAPTRAPTGGQPSRSARTSVSVSSP